ncbi:putative head adaptator [Vibrio phage 66E30.1]|nr:putative head completion adaptor [Vibrio phage 41E34.2]QZI91235.1 putative tail accessory factor [Vibrio phage 24E30.2]QZI91275.1 putative tail accessory factor [Vibrio phage 24E35.2]QZI91438.1 putative tail accessory factor [Vibrio phage 34E29.1]QZI91475.1 putative head completion factor [Vibrio phage 36E38.1]QZI91744.1 head completion adaptor [Vibrio phage 44E38.1]QZI91781.1 putative tail accessory factor [Vibrio phage 44E38.2]QZI91971.1 putative tail accessory factor [Vibrio phage 64E3
MATTVGDIIRSSMRKIGVLAAGEPLPANEGDDALQVFAQMVDAWTNETLLIPVVNVVTFQLTNDVSEYTIGIYPEPKPDPEPINHIETARPEKILAAFIRDQYDTDYIQEVIDVKTFSRISRKTNASRPSRFYVREGWPLNTILFESVPYSSETLHLEVIQPLSEILPAACLTEVINLPPGYERALIYNLCLDLADEWGKQPSAAIATHAIEGKKWLKRNNYRDLVLGMDRAVATQRKGIGTYIIEQGP